jgi:FixJ family two-component response regulator
LDASLVAVIDDDEAICKALGRLLRSAGFRAIAYNPAAAFLAETSPEPVACLVLDVQMPQMTGLQLQEWLLHNGRCPPLVLIPGLEGEEARETGLQRGAYAFLRKPLLDDELLGIIEQVLPRDCP